MFGEQAIKTIQDNWRKYVPVLLEQAAPTPPAELDEKDQLKAVEAIDKKLRPSRAGSKTTAAFAIFKVPYIVTEFYCMREPNKQHVTHHQQGLMGGGGEGGMVPHENKHTSRICHPLSTLDTSTNFACSILHNIGMRNVTLESVDPSVISI